MSSMSISNVSVVKRLLLVTTLLLSVVISYGQESRGKISGIVSDAGNAVVAGVVVKITNTAMGTTATTITNNDGKYIALYLIPGTYTVTVEHTGFKKYVRDNIVLRVEDSLSIDVNLEVGALEQVVNISTDVDAVETTNASLGKVIDSRRIAELPIAHGDPYKLIGTAPGTTFMGSQKLDRPFEPTHVVGYTVNGSRANRNDLTIDGIASTATANAGEVIASYVPPQDFVQEFKVQTAQFDAQFGNTEGGVTNLSIKSGSNNYHGSLGYTSFLKSGAANDFYSNRSGIGLADFDYKRYAGTIGGPLSIPKLYTAKNKTFFFFGTEGIIESRPRNNGTLTTPTQKMRAGDFTEITSSGFQLFNPYSGRRVTQTDGTSRIERSPFICDLSGNSIAVVNKLQDQSLVAAGTARACNKVPTALFNPIALNFVNNYLPLPTSAPTIAATLEGNFAQPNLLENTEYFSHTARVDHNISDKQRIFARYSWYDRDSDYNNYYNNIATGQAFGFFSKQAAFDDVYTLNPTTVLNFRYGYNRFIRFSDVNPGGVGFDLTSLGFPASYANLIGSDILRFPRFDITGYQGTGTGGESRPNEVHNVVAVGNKSFSKHILKVGTEFRAYRETDRFFGNDQSGRFNFDGAYTKATSATVINNQTGYSFASLLMGIASSGQIAQPADYAEQSDTWGFFAQDDWQVNSKLTLNFGLRYEFETPLRERFNKSVTGFDFTTPQTFATAAQTAFNTNKAAIDPKGMISTFNVNGGLLFAGVNGQSNGLYNTPKQNFMPRFGFAYQINPTTVVRGGYGIYFGFLGQRRGDVFQNGFATSTLLNVTTNNGVSFIETLSNPFSSGLNTVRGAADGISTFIGQSFSFFNQNPDSPYNQRWQLSVQKELPLGIIADVGYVGNRGTHVEFNRNINALPNSYLTGNAIYSDKDPVNTYLTALVPNPFVGLLPSTAPSAFRSATIARQQLLRPFPLFGDITTTSNQGYSWYHSLQLSADKRFSRGYTLGASYTFSKFMQATELLNAGDLLPTEMISDADRPHRFTLNGIVELPFGKGKSFFNNSSSVVNYLVGGWQMAGYYQFQSGAPLGNWSDLIFNGADLKDIVLSSDQQTLQKWINTGAGFPQAVKQVLYAHNRTFPLRFGFLRADKISNVDLSLMKKTRIKETKELQFRAELLNAFNHALLFTGGQIGLNPAVDGFGTVSAGSQENYPRRFQMTVKFIF